MTLFEKLPVAGGMMAVGIPRYRLPADTLQRDIDAIVSMPGVTMQLNSPVDLSNEVLEQRRKVWQPVQKPVPPGYMNRYRKMVSSAAKGAVLG